MSSPRKLIVEEFKRMKVVVGKLYDAGYRKTEVKTRKEIIEELNSKK